MVDKKNDNFIIERGGILCGSLVFFFLRETSSISLFKYMTHRNYLRCSIFFSVECVNQTEI